MSEIADAPDGARTSKKDRADLLSVVRSRLDAAIESTSESREDQLADLKFAAASPDNPEWQWPDGVLTSRTTDDGMGVRPTLTINKMPQHIKQVTNDQQQNRPQGKTIPANGEADVEMAEIYNGIIRHIQSDSCADVAYDVASENQVIHGEGYFRILTEYEDEDSFDQKAMIKSIRNSFSVYMDPMIQEPCGEDADWCFIVEDMSTKLYEGKYPDAMTASSLGDLGIGNSPKNMWTNTNKDTVRIAEYFYFETTFEELYQWPGGETSFKDEPKDKRLRMMYPDGPLRSRKSERKKVKWIKTNGYEVLEEGDWAGKFIPIILVPGNVFEIEGRVYRSGIVRNAKDAQRMYNYWSSTEAEMLALAPKAPYVGYAGQFEGFEKDWKTANTKNHPYLQVNAVVDDATQQVFPLPQRTQPPMLQSGIIAAKQAASEDIKETTGQYNASLGMQSNERSGKAILARQHEGDKSTYHYVSNLSRAIRYMTRQLIDLIPKIYDTERIAQILGEDGKTTKMVKIDPMQPQAVVKRQFPDGTIEKIYNPNVGKYAVVPVTGPGYVTKRQEAKEEMANILQVSPGLMNVAGDIFAESLDWPGADKFAKRMRRTIPAELLADDDDPEIQKAQQQIQQLQQQNQQMLQMLKGVEHSFEAREIAVKEQDSRTKWFDAETKRIQVVGSAMTPDQIHDIAAGVADAAIHHHLGQGGAPMPQQPQEPAPQLDPNKLLAEQSKHALQAQQHDHELKLAEMQPAPGGEQ